MRTRDTRVCRVYTHATRRLIAFLRRGVVLPAIHCRVLTFGTTRAWRGLEYSTPLHFDFRYNTKVLPSYTPCFVHVLYLLSYGANVLLDYLSKRPNKVRRARGKYDTLDCLCLTGAAGESSADRGTRVKLFGVDGCVH
jgi:hypothetical protein